MYRMIPSEEDRKNVITFLEYNGFPLTDTPQAPPPEPLVIDMDQDRQPSSGLDDHAGSTQPPHSDGALLPPIPDMIFENQGHGGISLQQTEIDQWMEDEMERERLRRRTGEAFVDVLRQMAFETGASYADVDTWLRILHQKKPLPDYATLPRNSRSMFKMRSDFLEMCTIRPMKSQVPKSLTVAAQRLYDLTAMGSYVYFGIETGLAAASPGQYLRRAYIAMLRRVNAANPRLLPRKLYQAAFGQEELRQTALDAIAPAGSVMEPRDDGFRPECILVTLKVFTDGAQVFQNSTKSSLYPLLVSVHAMCPINVVTGEADRSQGKMASSSLFDAVTHIFVRFCCQAIAAENFQHLIYRLNTIAAQLCRL
jgi:hypothetical protein